MKCGSIGLPTCSINSKAFKWGTLLLEVRQHSKESKTLARKCTQLVFVKVQPAPWNGRDLKIGIAGFFYIDSSGNLEAQEFFYIDSSHPARSAQSFLYRLLLGLAEFFF